MNAKSKTIFTTLITGLSSCLFSIQAQTFPTEWEGPDGASINDAGNWSDGLPTGLDAGKWGRINTANGLTVPGGDEDDLDDYRLWLDSGELTTLRNGRYLVDNFQLVMNGGSFLHEPTDSGNNDILILREGTSMDFRGGTTSFLTDNSTGLAFGAGGTASLGVPRVDISGGTHTWGNVEFRQENDGLNFLPGTYSLTLTNSGTNFDSGGSVFRFTSDAANQVNLRFAEGSGTLVLSAFDTNNEFDFENLWNQGWLGFIDESDNIISNATAGASFEDYFIVSGGNTLSAIPEPSTVLLLGIALGSALLFRRRAGR